MFKKLLGYGYLLAPRIVERKDKMAEMVTVDDLAQAEKTLDNLILDVFYQHPDERINIASHELFNAQMRMQKALKDTFPEHKFVF